MTDYNQTTITGNKWQRCKELHLYNPYNSTPFVIFGEEEVIALPDSQNIFINKGKECRADFEATTGTIELLDPTTGAPTGSNMSHQDLYVVLYSLYIATAKARDTKEAEDAARRAANA